MNILERRFTRVMVATLAATLLLCVCRTSEAQGTTFTWQGRLLDGGTPVNGTIDLQFELWDDPGGGLQIGGTAMIISVPVTDGLVVADLDFGAGAFDGSARWLEVSITSPSTGGVGPWTAVGPRQPVLPSPYAIHAGTAGYVPDAALTGAYSGALSMTNPLNAFAGDGSGLYALDAGNITAGVLGDAQFGGTYNNVVSLTSVGNVFTGDGAGLFNVDWNNLASVPAGFADGIDNAGDSLWGGVNPGNIYYTGGNIGIGTSTPNGRLNVVGGPGWTSNGWVKSVNVPAVSALELGSGGSTMYGIGASQNSLWFFRTTTENVDQPAQYFMTVNAAGRVGINNTAPTSPLTVSGNGNDWTIFGIAGTNGIGVVGRELIGTGRGVMGQVGINGFCGVSGDHGSGAYGLLGTLNEGVYGNGGGGGKIGVTGVSNGNTGVVGWALSGVSTAGVFGYSTATSGNGVIGEANTGSAAYGVWGRATQGIGGYFTGGQYALVAAGKAKVNTIEIIGGSDLAEPFDIAAASEGASLEPGMVVAIDPANPGALIISTEPYDGKVAGIISGANGLAPGMVMTAEGDALADGAYPVALTGRVWCWCDAAIGAIEPGHLLTTSSTPGHAMRANDRDRAHGAVIGKAMTPLAAGERGLVLVLVNLQ